MNKPSERIYAEAARAAAGLMMSAQLDAVVNELDREAERRAAWEHMVAKRLREIEDHDALSIPPLPRVGSAGMDVFDPGPSRYDRVEED